MLLYLFLDTTNTKSGLPTVAVDAVERRNHDATVEEQVVRESSTAIRTTAPIPAVLPNVVQTTTSVTTTGRGETR